MARILTWPSGTGKARRRRASRLWPLPRKSLVREKKSVLYIAPFGRLRLTGRSWSMARGREKDRKVRKKHRKNIKRVKGLAKARRAKRTKR